MVLSTKSGSNTFHGAVYWYNRNSALAANDWFNNQAGVKRTFLDLNQPGASLGGRIIKDKLFFYTNYEFYRNKQQSSTSAHGADGRCEERHLDLSRRRRRHLQEVDCQLAAVHDDPTVKAMIAQLPAPTPGAGRRRRTQHLGLSLQRAPATSSAISSCSRATTT